MCRIDDTTLGGILMGLYARSVNIAIFLYVVLCSSYSLAETAQKKKIDFPTIAVLFSIDELMMAQAKLASGCNPLLQRDCAEANAIVESHNKKSTAVRESIGRLSKEPLEFNTENSRRFSDETDLLDQLSSLNTKNPIVVFEHSNSPVYFLKFSSSALQEATLARIGIFVEGGGSVAPGEFPSLPVDGHDYRISDLSRFFNEVEKAKMRLNPMEERLLQALLKAGLLQKHRDEGTKKYSYIASKTAALVSVSGSDKPTLSHELNHAIYFLDSKYRAQVVRLYKEGLTSDEKILVDNIMEHLAKSGKYDFKNDQELFLTEFAAFFRDPDELYASYLKGLSYPEGFKIKIQSIAKKVRGLESTTQFYTIPLRPSRHYAPASAVR